MVTGDCFGAADVWDIIDDSYAFCAAPNAYQGSAYDTSIVCNSYIYPN